VSLSVAPPAISGGTLLVLSNGRTVVAADPDRDQVYLVDLPDLALTATIALFPGDEPGRVVEDAAGLVHVALRHGGGVVTIDPARGAITGRTAVCAAPRGLAYDPATNLVHVACAGGELVSVPASGGPATRSLLLDPDLRDVIVQGDHLRVSRFRSAELLTVDASGTVTARLAMPAFRSGAVRGGQLFTPAVAWRTVAMPDGGIAMVHQRGCDDPVQNGNAVPGGYGRNDDSSCTSIVHSAVSVVSADGLVTTGPALGNLPLPVDMAVSPDGSQIAVVSAGNSNTFRLQSAFVSDPASISNGAQQGCESNAGSEGCGGPSCKNNVPAVKGQATAIAFAPDGSLIIQTREPAILSTMGGSIALSSDSRADTGHTVFHSNAGGGLACASCHAEGLDDGRVWNFACLGGRRTQSVQVGLRGTEPFHWDGDEMDFPKLAHDVFTLRMSGPELSSDQADATLSWLDAQPRIPRAPRVDPAAVARGRTLFTTALCATCHAGEHLTDNKTFDVGTGGMFQVPSLVGVANHPPFLHNGCAATLSDRFSPACGGGDKHGMTSTLAPSDVSDLVSYLETL
jgi:mono/diheme cytochrome c family protein